MGSQQTLEYRVSLPRDFFSGILSRDENLFLPSNVAVIARYGFKILRSLCEDWRACELHEK